MMLCENLLREVSFFYCSRQSCRMLEDCSSLPGPYIHRAILRSMWYMVDLEMRLQSLLLIRKYSLLISHFYTLFDLVVTNLSLVYLFVSCNNVWPWSLCLQERRGGSSWMNNTNKSYWGDIFFIRILAKFWSLNTVEMDTSSLILNRFVSMHKSGNQEWMLE